MGAGLNFILESGTRAYEVPVTTLMQHVIGKEELDWPDELLEEVGFLRDSAILTAAGHRATQDACNQAAIAAAAELGIPLEDFYPPRDLPMISVEYYAAYEVERVLSEQFFRELTRLVRDNQREEEE